LRIFDLRFNEIVEDVSTRHYLVATCGYVEEVVRWLPLRFGADFTMWLFGDTKTFTHQPYAVGKPENYHQITVSKLSFRFKLILGFYSGHYKMFSR